MVYSSLLVKPFPNFSFAVLLYDVTRTRRGHSCQWVVWTTIGVVLQRKFVQLCDDLDILLQVLVSIMVNIVQTVSSTVLHTYTTSLSTHMMANVRSTVMVMGNETPPRCVQYLSLRNFGRCLYLNHWPYSDAVGMTEGTNRVLHDFITK